MKFVCLIPMVLVVSFQVSAGDKAKKDSKKDLGLRDKVFAAFSQKQTLGESLEKRKNALTSKEYGFLKKKIKDLSKTPFPVFSKKGTDILAIQSQNQLISAQIKYNKKKEFQGLYVNHKPLSFQESDDIAIEWGKIKNAISKTTSHFIQEMVLPSAYADGGAVAAVLAVYFWEREIRKNKIYGNCESFYLLVRNQCSEQARKVRPETDLNYTMQNINGHLGGRYGCSRRNVKKFGRLWASSRRGTLAYMQEFEDHRAVYLKCRDDADRTYLEQQNNREFPSGG